MIEPRLRFKADDGSQFPDWEEKVFGDFVDTHLEKTSDKDKYPLYSLTIESGVQPKTDRYEREFLVKKEGDNYKIVPPNAFVYNPMNLRFGALKVNHEKFSVSVSGYYDVFSLKDNSVLAFWENYLVTPKMLNYYFSISTGSLIEKLRVHYSQFVKIKKPLPSLPEQQKIAEFLSTIDTVIEKQKETVSAWEERKKGVMQKLFNQEVRFKADDGSDFPEWEEDMGCNRINIINGKPFDSKKFTTVDNGNPIIRIRDLDECTITLYSAEKYEAKYKVKKGNILIGMDGDFSVVKWNNVDVGLNQRIMHVIGKNDYIDDFMYYQLIPLIHEINVRTPFSTVKHLSSNTVFNMKLLIPCLAEQQKIADCLSSLDEVIEKQKATLAVWEELKKGLLQQMFV